MIEQRCVDIRNKVERTEFIQNLEAQGYIIDENTVLGKNCVIGEENAGVNKITVLGRNLTVKNDTVIPAGKNVDCI